MGDDELALWERFRQGDEEACEELVRRYLYLVKNEVGHKSRSIPWANREDLMQEGIRGLIKAIERFDPYRGNEFKAFAPKFIHGAIVRNPEVARDLPRRQYENHRDVKDVHDALMKEHGRAPTHEEIVEKTGLTMHQVLDAFDAINIAFAEELPDFSPESMATRRTVEMQDEKILVRQLLALLSEKERLIVTEHYWDDQSDREIAEKLKMKEDTVKKTRKRAIRKLRKMLEAEKRK